MSKRCTLFRRTSRLHGSTLLSRGRSAVCGGATGLHFITVYLWKAETELGLLTAGNGGGGGCLMQAQSYQWWQLFVSWMSHTHTPTQTKGMTDTGPCQTPPASSTPVQIHIETNIFNLFLIHKLLMAMHISIFHTANNQTSDHYLKSIYYSHITDCRPVQSQTFLEFNSYQKYSICGHNLRTLMTAYKHRSLQLGRERATVLIAIKITRLVLQDRFHWAQCK